MKNSYQEVNNNSNDIQIKKINANKNRHRNKRLGSFNRRDRRKNAKKSDEESNMLKKNSF